MDLITAVLPHPAPPTTPRIAIPADRLTLAKRRWRGVATDGRDFGFDLEQPLEDGALVFQDGANVYQLAQQPEAVLTVALGGGEEAARLGWLLGNLHFRVAVQDGVVLVPDDPAVRQALEREHIHFHQTEAVFRPLGGGRSHGHGHAH